MSILMLALALANLAFMVVNIMMGERKMALGCLGTAVLCGVLGLVGVSG